MRTTLTIACSILLLACPPAGYTQLERQSISSFTQQTQTQPEPLPLAQAFPFFVSELSPGKYRVTWDLAQGHYLYRHAFQFMLRQTSESDSLEVNYTLPDGIQKTDQFFGQIEAYYNQIAVDLELPTVPGPNAELLIEYQGCAEWGFCYPPQRFPFKLLP
ncbi:MAG: protein-disulfide reductase DsbD N-terminal domain-containing protein [Gammaproteobacteria bacterium]|nr:protein-disulfide reductase DsbD N-terminal domain-containing protein [Gammaproteobacteria bacterium]MDD9897313.1 protein-disulfide reductase DsbD N-terminal domain-containing protein [Gammaproteobacteria bacterium]MDD9959441.1 protein-disulfide reductase DsbD N-terminal domain-containing protein [Gammaproteobacteria bacterium]